MTHLALNAPTAAFQSLFPVLPGFRAGVKEEDLLVPWGKAAAGVPCLERGAGRGCCLGRLALTCSRME